jgi:membrane-associated phospholipid phosphatase
MIKAKLGPDVPLALALPLREGPWRIRLAACVSNVASPPVVTSLGIWLAATHLAPAGAWYWALQEWALLVAIPAAYVGVQVLRGRISCLDVSIREQRTGPYRMAMVCAWLAFVGSWLEAVPPALTLFAGAAAVQIIVLSLITRRWKISLHSAAMASFSVAAMAFTGLAGLPFLAGIPLVAWARVRLGRHTFWQTVAGACAGGAIYAMALFAVHPG